MMMRRFVATVAVTGLATALGLAAAQPTWITQSSGTSERLRGVSAVNASVAWASGNRGTIVRATDGGATWMVIPLAGTEGLDFRDIEAIDAKTVHVLSIGPGDASRIYGTVDGGATWKSEFINQDPRAFYDAIAFWDRTNGVAVGDPVDGRFTVVRTTDGGATWIQIPTQNLPPAITSEGAFAASGTCLVVQGTKNAWFGTGGAGKARVFRSTDQGLTWEVSDTPITAGIASAGIFSVAFADALNGVAVGGDYRQEQAASDNLARTIDGGKTWSLIAGTRFRGFRSAVEYVPGTNGRHLIAVGPAGGDISDDGGATWTSLGDAGFHAISLARSGDVAWAVGEKGRIAKLIGLK